MQHVHFIGICGTAMGAVASAMAREGYTVTGSDANVYPPMSDFLSKEGIKLFEGYAATNIPDTADIIVVGNAISRGNEEVEAVLERKLRYLSLPEALKEYFLRGKRNYIISGTHGKTTTTSMLAWIFESSQRNPSFMIGGIASNLGRGGRFTDSPFCVLEGDEYDTAFFDKRSKFLHYLPELVIINNIEFDHADIYANIDEIKLSFRRLLQVVPRSGLVLANADCNNTSAVVQDAPCPVQTVGLGSNADHQITDIAYNAKGATFTIDGASYYVPMVGEFNVRNAAMAIIAAQFAGISYEDITVALTKFEGVARRQEVKDVINGIAIIDDFAHHPTAMGMAITAIKQKYPKGRIWAIIEPRSNSMRRKVFQHPLARALASADRVVVCEPENPCKVTAEERLCLDTLRKEIQSFRSHCSLEPHADAIVANIALEVQKGDVLLVMSNGGFDGIHSKLASALHSKFNSK